MMMMRVKVMLLLGLLMKRKRRRKRKKKMNKLIMFLDNYKEINHLNQETLIGNKVNISQSVKILKV